MVFLPFGYFSIEYGALPHAPPKKLFEKSFFGIFKNLNKGHKLFLKVLGSLETFTNFADGEYAPNIETIFAKKFL